MRRSLHARGVTPRTRLSYTIALVLSVLGTGGGTVLTAQTNGVAGAILPNINDGFVGAAPDLGAYELGQPLPTYGPRLLTPPIAPTNLRIVR